MSRHGDMQDWLKADLARMEQEFNTPIAWLFEAYKVEGVSSNVAKLKKSIQRLLHSNRRVRHRGIVVKIDSSDNGLIRLHIESTTMIYEVMKRMVPFKCGGYEMKNVKEEPSDESLES